MAGSGVGWLGVGWGELSEWESSDYGHVNKEVLGESPHVLASVDLTNVSFGV